MKLNIFLCLLSHESGRMLQNVHFPLSIGLLSEYIKYFMPNVKTELFKRPSIFDQKINEEKPDIVMFSNYMWNEKLNCFYANEIKKRHPDTLIVMGGPNISKNEQVNTHFLIENPSIDILVRGDGEKISKIIIQNFINNNKNIKKLN